jgi:ribokinase
MTDKLLLCCGGLRTDYIITPQGEARLMEMGGNALYSAAGAKLWNTAQVALLARVGDNYPLGWLDDLREAGFDVDGIRRVSGAQDHRTFYAYIDEDTRDDTNPAHHFERVGLPMPDELRDYTHSTPGQDDPNAYEPLAVTPEDLALFFEKKVEERTKTNDERRTTNDPSTRPVGQPGQTEGQKSAVGRLSSIFSRHAALHIAPSSIRTQRFLPEAARRFNIPIVSVDPGERAMQPELLLKIEDMLAEIDIFLPSDQETQSLFRDATDEMDAKQCARWFAERGPAFVVLKLGSDGALVHQRGGAFWHVPALPIQVVDSTGAGDAFCGGFMADFLAHADPVRAAITGTVSASFALQDYGARHLFNIPEHEYDHRAAYLRGLVTTV